MEKELGEIKANLKKYGQEHILNHFEELDETHQKELLNDKVLKEIAHFFQKMFTNII